jgi:hypothetical protein
VALSAGVAAAQSVNVSFGHASGGPSSSYAAAGSAGVWNAVTGTSGVVFKLVDTDGKASTVTVSQSPTTTMLSATDASLVGDDAALLNSGLVTTGAETCLTFNGLQAGSYEVLVYAWLPAQPTVKSRTRQDQAPSTIDVGGAWSGAHAVGVTYARYVVTVDASGYLPAHSGLATGAPDSALNGVQIRPLPAAPPVDAGTPNDASLAPSTHDGGTDHADASAPQTVDAATTPNPTLSHHGGCSLAGSTTVPIGPTAFALLLVLLGRRRRREA